MATHNQTDTAGHPPELGNTTDSADFFFSFHFSKEAHVLDVGSNIGSFLSAIHTAGWENVQGIDIEAHAVTFAKNCHPEIAERFSHYDGRVIPFPNKRFDVATLFNVIEHIPPDQMESFLKEILRVLKPGGSLVIMTPCKYIDMFYETIRYKNFGWRTWHCSLQTVSSMRNLLRRCGFDSVEYDKIDLKTDYYLGRAKQYLGPLGLPTVQILSRLPLGIFPTISAVARKGV